MANGDPTSEHRPSPGPATGFASRIADPGPLGLAGFAGTTLFLSLVNAGVLDATAVAGVFSLAIFYGGTAQLLAGLWEFAKGNTFGSTAFVSFGAFWLSFWWLNTHTTIPEAQAANVVGTYLLVWTIFTAYMFVASLRTTGAIASVFLFLALTFLFLCIGNYEANETIVKVGGYLGIITAVLAFYGSFAAVTNETFKRVVLPVVPLQPR